MSERSHVLNKLWNRYTASATLLVLTTALISGTNNFLTKTAVDKVSDPIVFTTLKNMAVAVLLVGIMAAYRKRREIASLTKKQLGMLAAIGVIGGSLPFAMFFTGLSMTSAVNAAFIHKTLFIWVALLAIPLLKERMRAPQWLGIGAIFAANLVIGGFQGFRFNTGELLVLGATILWAVENMIAKVTLRDVSAMTVAASRMVLGGILLSVLMILQGGLQTAASMTASQWTWILATGVLLLGYVLTWYSALKRAPATYVATLLVPATLVTNVLSAVFVTGSMTGRQVIGSILFVAGAALMIGFARHTAIQTAHDPTEKKVCV